MKPVKEVKAGNKVLRIFNDDNSDSPRTWDNMGKMICSHRRYNLGDKHDFKANNYDSFKEFQDAVVNKKDIAVLLPLFLYDHSGITMRTTSFNDRFDSGQVGFIFVTKEQLRKELNVKRLTKKHIDQAKTILEGEVETYDQFLRGDVYRFEVLEVSKCNLNCEHENSLDSCGGFYGDDFKTNGITDHLVDEDLIAALKAA